MAPRPGRPSRHAPRSPGPALRMPAEWEPHAATWLAWPHNAADWPGKFETIPWLYVEIVRHLSRAERVEILVPRGGRARVRRMLRDGGARLGNVRLHAVPTDRSWLRDTAPTFVRGGGTESGLVSVHWRFNGWAKYRDWRRDDAIKPRVAAAAGARVVEPQGRGRRVVMEGGAFDVDGRGLLLATEECLLSRRQQRNPGLGRAGYEEIFRDALGARRVLWLGHGIAGDDTHGHVDDCARFVAPGRVLAAIEPDRGDPNHEVLSDNLARLRRMTDLRGRRLRVETLPMPAPLFFRGRRVPASYANFYVANGLVLVPTFNDPADRAALAIVAGLFPRRRVVGIPCVDLVWGLGTLHCATQQQPAAGAD